MAKLVNLVGTSLVIENVGGSVSWRGMLEGSGQTLLCL